MDSDTAPSHPGLEKSLSSGYVPPNSDTRKSLTSSSKKRASRAGARSVSTLSIIQLERKRANDREAQRAIRQRTKDYIDHLERSVNDLRGSQEANEKLVFLTQQRNQELEEEVVSLRGKLGEAGLNISALPTEHQPPLELALPPLASTPGTASGSSIESSRSTSLLSSSCMTTPSTGSHHDLGQRQSASFVGTAAPAIGLPNAATVAGLTIWRSHDSTQPMQDPISSAPYTQDQSVVWPVNADPYQQYGVQVQQRQPQHETAPAQQQRRYSQPYYTKSTTQSKLPNTSVSCSPSSYQMQNKSPFQQPGSFQVAPFQVPTSSTESIRSPCEQMQRPPLLNAPFHLVHGEQPYGAQLGNHALQYRDEGNDRSYSLTH